MYKKPRNTQKQSPNNQVTMLGKALRVLGIAGGAAAGGMIGVPNAGAIVGHGLGAALSRWTGNGDYKVTANSIISKASGSIPVMHKNDQTITVRHREFIGPISGSVGFTVQKTLNLNPGLEATFPWLSGLASRFQEYKVKGMVYHYIPTSGTFNGSTAALGSVMIQTTYRATDSAPVDKAEMLNEYWANECVPYETMVHPIECSPTQNPFSIHYIRQRTVVGSEPLLYDLAKTFVATQGMADTSVVGDLWVTYEIELKKPIVTSSSHLTTSYYAAVIPFTVGQPIFFNPVSTFVGETSVVLTGNTMIFPKYPAKYYICVTAQPYTLFNISNGYGWLNDAVLTNCALTQYDDSNGYLRQMLSAAPLVFGGLQTLVFEMGIEVTQSDLQAVLALPTLTLNTPAEWFRTSVVIAQF